MSNHSHASAATRSPRTSDQAYGWYTASSSSSHHASYQAATPQSANTSYGLTSLGSGSSGGMLGSGDNKESVFIIGRPQDTTLFPPTSLQQTSAPASSPLFDCVTPAPLAGIPMSSRESDSSSATYYRQQRPRTASKVDKDLPQIPQANDDYDQQGYDGYGSGTGDMRSGSLENGRGQALLRGTSLNDTHHTGQPVYDAHGRPTNSPRGPFSGSEGHSGSSPNGILDRLSPSWSSVKGAAMRSKNTSPRYGGKSRTPPVPANTVGPPLHLSRESAESAALVGLGVENGSAGETHGHGGENGSEKDAAQTWLGRAAAVKMASQSAGIGLKKWGKASAAKLKQTPHLGLVGSGGEGSLLVGAHWGKPSGSGLRRYDGRAAKSAADLPMTSSDANALPPPLPNAFQMAAPDPRIGLPTDVRHNVHVDIGPQGYTGLPASWAQVLAQYGLNAEDVRKNPAGAVQLIRERTQYYVDKEAERGQDPEHTKRVLESRLGNLQDFREARNAVRSIVTVSNDNDEANGRRVSSTSTTYSSVLNQSWPASPSWSDAPAVPQLPSKHALPSPSLPQVIPSEDLEDDWAGSILKALPMSDSHESKLRAIRRRTLSLDSHAAATKQQLTASEETERVPRTTESRPTPQGADDYDDAGEAEELQEKYDGTSEDAESSSIMTASRVRVTRTPPLMSSSDSDAALAARLMSSRRGSSDSVGSRAASHQSFGARQLNTPEPRSSSVASRSASSSTDEAGVLAQHHSSTTATSNSVHSADIAHFAQHGTQNALASHSGMKRPESAGSTATQSDLGSQISHGLRERRKIAPRIYPPSANKYQIKEDAPSPRSIGFKPAQQPTHNSSSPDSRPGSDSGRLSSSMQAVARRATPLLDTVSRDHASDSGHAQMRQTRSSSGQESVQPPTSRLVAQGEERNAGAQGGHAFLAPLTQVQSSTGHVTPDLILPDADGFFRPGSGVVGASGGSSTSRSIDNQSPTDSVRAGVSPIAAEDWRGGGSPRGNTPLSTPSPLLDAHRTETPALSYIEDDDNRLSGVQDDYQPASDFINDWLAGGSDEAGSDDDGSTGFTETSSRRSRRSRRPSRAQQNAPPPLTMQPTTHQSPSPALLLGLPTPLRAQFGTTLSPPLASSNTAVLRERNGPAANDGATRKEGWSILGSHLQTPAKPVRDWRVRSLPPPPPDEVPDVEDPMDANAMDDRASVYSLPMNDDEASAKDGPPMADVDALEAAALTRPSSRASRSSSRAGGRLLRRRDSDARRFPVSMHYASGFDSDSFVGGGSKASSSFADLMRARQSMDLDDVMPMQIESHDAEQVPPVPALPSIHSFVSQAEVSKDAPSDKAGEVRPAFRHLVDFLRTERPVDIFGDLVLIGEGESGNVFSAVPAAHCRVPSLMGRGKVAIKVVRTSVGSSSGSDDDEDGYDDTARATRLQNLDKELLLWRDVGQHKNLVRLYDVFDGSAGQLDAYRGVWIVQEYMSMSLADVIAIKADGLEIHERHMARILHDVSEGLVHLHAKSVVHRDVRSDNILLAFDGIAKLSDFTHAVSVAASKRNSVVGTAYWMAPEVVKAEPYDCAADIWGLGVVLFEMLEGAPPRVEFPALRAITLTAKLGLPALSSPEQASSALKACLAWCTEMRPERRPSAETVLLSEFVSSSASAAELADLIEAARTLEAEAAAQDEEVLDDGDEVYDTERAASPQANGRESWTSQSTIQGRD